MSLLRLRSLVQPRYAFVPLASRRRYSTLPTNCPSCGKPLPTRLPICPACSHIATLPSNTSYHALFGLPENAYKIDVKDLRNRFLQAQRLTHPDAWSGKPEEAKATAANHSSLVNKGYETLRSPLHRAEYLLSLRGAQAAEEDSVGDQAFLLDVMEAREHIEENSVKEEIQALSLENKDRIHEETLTIAKAFESGDIDAAREATIKLRYLEGIEKSIQEKLHGM